VSRRRDITTEAVQRRLEVTFRVLIACTDLGADEWSAAETGDAVLFEGTSFPDPFEPWLVHLTCGTHQAEARLSIDGTLSIASEFEIHGTPHRSCGQPGKDPMSTSAESRASRAEALLASAPVEIVAEIGRITLPAAEVLALGPGSVLPLGWIRPESVDLRVGDRSWARGELVDLDGQLAVRLTSVASAPTPANTPPGDTQPIR
jgi:type III secretion system YscQ/HrcQ family protein